MKHRKAQRGSRTGMAWRGATVAFGEYGLQALDRAWMTTTQIEACRVALSRNMKRRGKLWIRIFPDCRSRLVRPRRGWARAKARRSPGWRWCGPGNVLFEMGGVTEVLARESLRLAAAKLPIATRFVERR